MVSRTECMREITSGFPDFNREWQEYTANWVGEAPGLCLYMSEFSGYVCQIVLSEKNGELKPIFALIEHFMVEGDGDVQDAVATCFLENLLNQSSAGNVNAEVFAPLLGNKSRSYCQSWDHFTGVETKFL